MRQQVRSWLAAIIMIVVAATSAFAQGGSTSQLIGTVTDASGAVIPGATVVAKNNATQTEFTATTKDQGGFTLPAVDLGSYSVTVTLLGLNTFIETDFRFNSDTPTHDLYFHEDRVQTA